jgi:hypothetical protein
MENANGVPISFYLNTVYYSLNTGEKRVIPKIIESTNLISKEKIFTNLWGPLGPPDTTIKGTDNICMPRCDTLSRLLLLPHKEDTVFKANRRYIPMINSFYLGIKNNPKSYSIGSLLKNSKPVRPLTNTISYIYLHPQGNKFSYIKELEVLDITRFKDIYVYNFFLWWTGSEYSQQ